MFPRIFYGAIILTLVECRKDFEFETFGHCLKQNENPSLIKCAGQQALETLQQFSSLDNFTLTKGLTLSRDESAEGRNNPINFIDNDPNDIRSMLENAGLVMSHRSMQWDMPRVYPGLQLRIGPSINGGLMEFVIDPATQNDERSYLLHEESTARIMTRKFVLPFLLGIKFNLATLLPLILGAIILISKKAAFLSKLALFISGMFGLGGIYSGLGGLGGGGFGHGFGYPPPLVHHDPGVHHHQFASPYKILENNTPRNEEQHQHLPDDHFYDFDNQHLLKDRMSRLYERDYSDKKASTSKFRSQRNFVWQTAN